MLRRLAVPFAVLLFLTPSPKVRALEPAAELVTAEGFTGTVFSSISADGSALVAGVPFAHAPGGGGGEGAVYVFRNVGRSWSQEAKLFAAVPIEDENMGRSVAIQGDVIVAGAPYSTTFQPDRFGQAYVFRRINGTWAQEQVLLPTLSHDGDNFGIGSAAGNGRILVGASGYGAQPGRAFVFGWDGAQWAEEGVLGATDLGDDDLFGHILTIGGDLAIVGVPAHDDPFPNAGAAYAFRYEGNSWVQDGKLIASDTASGDLFGASVELSGDLALIGAPGRGVSPSSFGAVYIFQRTSGGWVEKTKILPFDPQNSSGFGSSLSLADDALLVTAPGADDAGLFPGQGAAYLFDCDGLNWIEREKIARPRHSMEFGELAAASGKWVFLSSQSTLATSIPSSVFAYCVSQDAPCIPTLSAWGVTLLALLVMIAATAVLKRRPAAIGFAVVMLSASLCVGDDPRLSFPHHPEQLLVRFKSAVDASCRSALHAENGALELRRDRYVDGLTLVRVPAENLARALAAYSTDPDVLYAEPDYRGRFFAEPNDDHFGDQWGMQDSDAGIRGPSAWDLWTGDPEFRIAVLDTGANLQHEDLVGNIWCNPVECPGIFSTYGWCWPEACAEFGDVNEDGCPGVCDVVDDGDGLVDEDSEGREPGDGGYTNDLVEDDDENGYPNDASGWNFAPDTESEPPQPSYDVRGDTYHGTHMSGIIAGVANNDIGIAGINWSSPVVLLKVGLPPPNQGFIQVSDAIDALDYVIANKIRVSNNSYGWYTFSQCHYDKIEATQAVDHLFIAAAGNKGIDNDSDPDPAYPTSYELDNIIAVAAIDDQDELGEWIGDGCCSNYGEVSVDLGAPGVDILSTTSHDFLPPPAIYLPESGTSMAAAHVTGVVALMRSLNPHWDYETVKSQLLASVRPVESLDGITVTGGANAYAAINDCNLNSVPDDEDVAEETSEDCNENYWPDECDIARGNSDDCELNGIPDECETLRACCPNSEPPCIVTTYKCCLDLDGWWFSYATTCPQTDICQTIESP